MSRENSKDVGERSRRAPVKRAVPLRRATVGIFALALGLGQSALAQGGEATIETVASTLLRPRGAAVWNLSATEGQLRTESGSGDIIHIPAAGQSTFFHLRFRVDGPASSVDVSVSASIDGTEFCSVVGNVETGIPLVARCIDAWTAAPGLHVLEWKAELVSVAEADETENVRRRIWNTGAALDLAASGASFRTVPGAGVEVGIPAAGETVFFHLARSDAGLSDAVTIPLRADLDGESYCSGSINPIAGPGQAWCTNGWTATSGAHTLTWTLDPDDELAEVDEGNNTVSTSWVSAVPITVVPIQTPTAADGTPTPLVDPVDPTYGPRRAPPVVGDCNGDRKVAINELISGVRIALGTATLATCAVFDSDRSFSVSIAELIQAVVVALNGSTRGAFLPDVFLRIVPGGLLLPEGEDTAVLRVDAFESDGDPVAIGSLDIEWVSSDPDLVRVDVDSADSSVATVTVLDDVCNAFVLARLRDEPLIMSPPANVMRAKLHPDAAILPDDMVVFPPPNLPDGVDISGFEFPEYVPPASAGGNGSFGGFSEGEIATYLDVNDDFVMRYPVVLRGRAPAIGQRLVAGGGAPISGVVVGHVQRGDFCLVQLEIVPPQELFEDLDFSVSLEQLQADGLLTPVDTSDWEDDSDFVPDTAAATSGLFKFEVGRFECKPPTATAVRPSFTQSPAPSGAYFGPIWDGNLQISDYTVQRFFFKVGLLARAFFRPELRLTPGVTAAFTCDIQSKYRKKKIYWQTGAMAAVLAPYIEGFVPSLAFGLDVSGGPTMRFGMNIGFDYSYWTGASYTAATGWEPLCESWDVCSRTNQTNETFFDADSGPQITVEGRVGGFAVGEAGVVGLGGFLALVDNLPIGPLLQGVRDSIEEKMQVRLFRARIGPELTARWHNGRRTAFIEESESAANIVLKGDLRLTLDAITKYLRTVLNIFNVLSVPLIELNFYHLAEPYRILTEETLTVNGQRYAFGDPAVKVGQGQSVPVVSTITRDFINLTPVDLFLPRLTPHQEFPHTGELLLDGEVIATLTPSNDFRLNGSFEATRTLCERAEGPGGPLEVKVLAYNRMFRTIPTANYAGSFKFACTDNQAPVVDAGPDQEIDLNESARMSGSVEDDGLPIPPGVTVSTWSGSGPGQVEFGDRRNLVTRATFSEPGVYEITLTADDGELATMDKLTVTVRALGDRDPPELTVEPCGGTFAAGDNLQLEVEASDASGIAELTATIPPGVAAEEMLSALCGSSNTCSDTFRVRLNRPLDVDIIALDIEAVDRAGNRTTQTCRYEKPGSGNFTMRLIADSNMVAPGTDDLFGSIGSRATVGNGRLVFRGVNTLGNFGSSGLYGDIGAGLEVLADRNTPLPDPFGVTGCVFGGSFEGLSIDGDSFLFSGGGTCSSTYSHLYLIDLDSYVRETSTGISGFTMRGFGVDPSQTPELVNGGFVTDAFLSGERIGVVMKFSMPGDDPTSLYAIDRDQPPQPPGFGPAVRIADFDTPVPGDSGTLERISDVAYDDGSFAFRSLRLRETGNREGVYASFNLGSVELIADMDTSVPQGEGTFRSFCGVAIDGTNVAFVARGDGTQQGVYLARSGELQKIADYDTPVPGRTETFRRFECQVGFDDGRIVFGGSHSVASVSGGIFLYENGSLTKVIERGDTLDGLTVRQARMYGDKTLNGNDLVFGLWVESPSDYRAVYLGDLSR
jgi:hypothetical protein